MSAAALSSGADGDGRQSQRKRDVGVGGGAIQMRPDAEVRVHGADILQNGSIVGEASAGARSDLFDLAGDLASGGAIVLRFQRPLYRTGQQAGNLVDLCRAFRADIDLGA